MVFDDDEPDDVGGWVESMPEVDGWAEFDAGGAWVDSLLILAGLTAAPDVVSSPCHCCRVHLPSLSLGEAHRRATTSRHWRADRCRAESDRWHIVLLNPNNEPGG